MSEIYLSMLNIIELLSQLNLYKLNYSASLSIYKLHSSNDDNEGKESNIPQLENKYYEIQHQTFRNILDLILKINEFSDITIDNITQYLTELSTTLNVPNYRRQTFDAQSNVKFQKALDITQSLGNSALRDLLINYKTEAYN